MSDPFSHTNWRSDTRSDEPAVPEWYGVPESRTAEAGADRRIVWAGEAFFVPLARSPYNNGHLHIVPRREVAGYRDLTSAERKRLGALIDRAIYWLDQAYHPEGFNVGFQDGPTRTSAERTPFYASILPRWTGDTNFMVTVHETTVLPGSLEDSYDRLRRAATGSPSD